MRVVVHGGSTPAETYESSHAKAAIRSNLATDAIPVWWGAALSDASSKYP